MEKVVSKASTGMILGKFMPVHRGHQHLIDFARRRVDHLTVLVCSLESEPIPGHLRYEWVRELYPDVNVVHCADENPSEPKDHSQFWEIWLASIRRFIPVGPDYVFTSEYYGDELAARLGARHLLVDLDRKTVPVSATMIRERPFDNWQFIPECVRPYFAKRVAIVGPESTGKTTLAAELARHFETICAPEFARDYLDRKYGESALELITPDDIEAIARGQIATEDAMARKCNRLLVCDTELITTTLWSEHFFGACSDWIRREARERNYDLYLLTDFDAPWVADSQRVSDFLRKDFFDKIRGALAGRRYEIISGSYKERLQKAVGAVGAILDQNPTGERNE
ncbi:MAG TPA: AAA family ATPase [Blastocatellia bacterium]